MISEVDAYRGFCPVQVYGTVEGYPFYLRMRDVIELYVASAPDRDPMDDVLEGVEGAYYTSDCIHGALDEVLESTGKESYPGWASDEQAAAVLWKALELYTERPPLFAY